jgi:branched-chain amino acid aminotransferase
MQNTLVACFACAFKIPKPYLAPKFFMEGGFLNYNGKVYPAGKQLISPNNRSFRYGDGFFETMKMLNGKIVLGSLHFERLFSSLETMLFNKPKLLTAASLEEQIIELAKKNKHTKSGRVRLMIFRGDGGLYDAQDNHPNYLIQTWEMNDANNSLNENGLVIDIFKDAHKACDKFSHIKSNNYLSYVMAALWAKQQKLNDALVLNSLGNIADATIANLFIVKDGIILTPALTEGCVAGTMRRYLLQCMRKEGMPVQETGITIDDLISASEVFLTNAGYGLRWVQSCGSTNYTPQAAPMLYKKFIERLYTSH